MNTHENEIYIFNKTDHDKNVYADLPQRLANGLPC